MAQEAAVPLSTVKELIRKEVDAAISRYARSGPLRNASITGGAGLSIRDGGALTVEGGGGITLTDGGGLSVEDGGDIDVNGGDVTVTAGGRMVMIAPDGTLLFLVGPVGQALPDGTPQQGWIVRRADGTNVLDLFDADPSDGVLRQALNWRDRSGNVVLADDTDSGQGHARPWLSGGFSRYRYADMTVSTTSSTFETLWEARISKQQPLLAVRYRASMDASGNTGQTRVLVNNVPFGATTSEAFAVATRSVGPQSVAGSYSDELFVQIQGRRTSATGALRVEALEWETRQS